MTDAHGAAAAAAAWYVDPTNPQQWRWWDGSQWTQHVAPLQAPAASADAAAATADAGETNGRWPMPAADAPLHPGSVDVVVPSLSGRVRTRVLQRSPQLLMSLLGSAILMAIDGALSSNRRRFNPLDPTALSEDDYQEMRSQGPYPIVEAMRQIRDEARDEVWDMAFAARGLDPATSSGSPTNWIELRNTIPVLNAAADVYPRWMRRSELRGFPAWWGELAAMEPEPGTNSMPRVHRHFAIFQVPPGAAARHRAVSVGKKRRMPIRRGRYGFEQVEIESIAVADRLTVHVKAGTDPVAVRELFGSQLVAALADEPVYWDQRFEHLFVYRDSSAKDPLRGLDAFLETAAAVARAYWSDQE